MPVILVLILLALVGYLWGSVPSGYWMGKLLRGKNYDIRDYGSHKTGATNVLRALGRWPAAIVLAVDLSKGVGPTLLATFIPIFFVSGWGPTVAGLMALLGHCFPIFIGFKGGRGVMTGSGALLVIEPFAFLACLVTTTGTIALSRYVSLGSIVGSLTAMLYGIIFYFVGHSDPTFIGRVSLAQLVFLLLGPALVILFHYDNIDRLLAGKERKIGQNGTAAAPTSAPSRS